MNNQFETLCWGCKNATMNKCAWMARKEPVNGWKAEKTNIKCKSGAAYDSYYVAECPESRKGWKQEGRIFHPISHTI